jgi:hypothetical protein
LRVKALTFENQPFWAYNLEVGEDHTFFVGMERAWVHNSCSLPAPKPANVPWAPGIQLYREGNMTTAEHIFFRHGPSSGFANVSRFAQGTSLRNVRDFINEAAAKGTRSGKGITYDFGRVIGYNQQGNPTTRLQIWLNNVGEVRTAFPY